jgi:hypothetical protein
MYYWLYIANKSCSGNVVICLQVCLQLPEKYQLNHHFVYMQQDHDWILGFLTGALVIAIPTVLSWIF